MDCSSCRSLYGLYPYKSSMIGMENLGDPSGNWDIVETIGKGTYGKVYRVTNKKDGSQAAVKVLDPINVSQHVYLLQTSNQLWLLRVCVSCLLYMLYMNHWTRSQVQPSGIVPPTVYL